MTYEDIMTKTKTGTANILLRRIEDIVEIIAIKYHGNGFYFSDSGSFDYFKEILSDEYICLDMYKETIKDQPNTGKEQFFEIFCDVYNKSWKSWTDCGWEYDAETWIENEKIKLIEDKYIIEGICVDYDLEEEITKTEDII